MPIEPIIPEFGIQSRVGHVMDVRVSGIVTAINLRGSNLTYEVQWGIEKILWHHGFELRELPTTLPPIGFIDSTAAPP